MTRSNFAHHQAPENDMDRQIKIGDRCEEGTVIKVMSPTGGGYHVWLRRPDGSIRKRRVLAIEGVTERAR